MELNRVASKCNEYASVLLPYKLTAVDSRRIIKCTSAVLIAFIFCLIDPVVKVMGTSAYVIVMLCVLVHPGRRTGAMIESVVLAVLGVLFGLAYCIFGHYVAAKIMDESSMENALAFLAVLEILMLFFHGFIRNQYPRLFLFVFFLFLVVHFGFLSAVGTPLNELARDFSVPFYLGAATCLGVNLLIFPEFGSTYLGSTTIDSLNALQEHVTCTVGFFLGNPPNNKSDDISLESIQKQRSSIRSLIATSKSVMQESLFEVSYSFMSPQELNPVLKKISNAASTSYALVGACEVEYALLGESHLSRDKDSESSAATQEDFSPADLPSIIESIKPQREIELGDEKMLLEFIRSISDSVLNLCTAISQSLDAVKLSVAYSYDVPFKKLNESGSAENGQERKKIQISLEDLDRALSAMARAIDQFDNAVPQSLEKIKLVQSSVYLEEEALMPREEFFLISSFLLNLHEFSNTTCKLLGQCSSIIAERKKREKKNYLGRSVWFSGFSSREILKEYLLTGTSAPKEGDISSIHSTQNVSSVVENNEFESESKDSHANIRTDKPKKLLPRIRHGVAEIFEFLSQFKESYRFAFKFTTLLMLLSFPEFSTSTRQWYINIRGSWVGFVAAVSIESSIGATVKIFMGRSVGLVIGSAWGYASYVAGWNGKNGYIMTVMVALGVLPAFYVLMTSSYQKAAMVSMVSGLVVILSTTQPTIPGTIRENFAKRCIAMLIGGSAALLSQMIVFPVKARVQLVRQIVVALRCCEELEEYMEEGIGLEEDGVSFSSKEKVKELCKKSRTALDSAEAYRVWSSQEPRLKGPFSYYQKIYKEIIFVLNQITDKFQNALFLRARYGSVVLEDMLPFVQVYRRDLYGCLKGTLRAAEEALTTKEPMPQFLPSARISHLRLVNRVREVMVFQKSRPSSMTKSTIDNEEVRGSNTLLQRKYMSWSAFSGAMEDIIEYVEELVELMKLVVGVSEFRHGFLSRPLYEDWAVDALLGFKMHLHRTATKDNLALSEFNNDNQEKKNSHGLSEVLSRRYENYIPKLVRKRAFSVVGNAPSMSVNEGYLMHSFHDSLSRVASLEDARGQPDTDIPIALKKVISKKVR